MAYCDNCEYRKKLKFSTIFFCEKFKKALDGNPPVRLEECVMEKNMAVKETVKPQQDRTRAKKKYIEVK